MREEHRVGEDEPEHAARGTDRGNERAGQLQHDELRDRRGDDAHEVVDDVARPAERLLDRAAEHVQAEHVEREMEQAPMQERVGDELPGREAGAGHEHPLPPTGHSANASDARGIDDATRNATMLSPMSVAVTGGTNEAIDSDRACSTAPTRGSR